MNRIAVLVALVVPVSFLVGCGSATSPSESNVVGPAGGGEAVAELPPTEQQSASCPFRKILCFGDSLTYGTTLRTTGPSLLTPVEGYVPKLARLLVREYGSAIELINSSAGAEITAIGRERFTPELVRHDPDLVLLLEGVVDVNGPSPRFTAARRNLRAMMAAALDRDIAIIIGTYPPLDPDGFRIGGIANVPTLNAIIREEAAGLGVPVADHEAAFGNEPGLQGPDGLHPNDRGYERMAETWFAEIQALVATGCR